MIVNNYFINYFRSLNLGRNFLQESFSSKKVSSTTTKSLQSCPTLCNPMDCSLPGFSIHGILQARTLEWVAISFSWKWKVKVKSLSRVWLLATPWTACAFSVDWKILHWNMVLKILIAAFLCNKITWKWEQNAVLKCIIYMILFLARPCLALRWSFQK